MTFSHTSTTGLGARIMGEVGPRGNRQYALLDRSSPLVTDRRRWICSENSIPLANPLWVIVTWLRTACCLAYGAAYPNQHGGCTPG
jgi:hypothetical protein